MNKNILVSDLLENTNCDRVCELVRIRLSIAESDASAVRKYFGGLLDHLKTLTPHNSENLLFVVPLAVGNRVFISPITAEQYDDLFSSDIPSFQDHLDHQKDLIVMSWEKVLGMPIIWFPSDIHIPSNIFDLVAAELLAYISFLGASPETRNKSMAALDRKATIAEHSDNSTITITRVCPWFVPDAVVTVDAIIQSMKTDPHFTLFGVFADIWGIPDWTIPEYLFLISLFAAPSFSNGAQITISIELSQSFPHRYYNCDDALACLEKTEQHYIWTYYEGKPHCTRLIHSHHVDDNGMLHVFLDSALKELYISLYRHYQLIDWELLLNTFFSSGFNLLGTVVILELLTTYLDMPEVGFSIPMEVLIRNTPTEDC